jgi:signal transduction histidine kinase
VLAHDVDHLLASVIGDLQGPALDAARERVELVRRLLLLPDERALEAAPADAGAVVARLAPLLRRALPDSVRLDVETPDAPIWAHVDAAALESALLELALNARDAMPQGGTLRVRVTVALVDAREGQELELKPGAYAKLAFSDTGGGAMPDLATIDTFARRSQGALRIASTPGLGTTVALWLRGAEAPA